MQPPDATSARRGEQWVVAWLDVTVHDTSRVHVLDRAEQHRDELDARALGR
jgi:hypothetical protein